MCLPGSIRELTARVLEVGEVDPSETQALMQRIHAEAPGMGPDGVRELQGLLRDLEEAIQVGQAGVRQKLHRGSQGRRAIRGYGCVRSHKRGQRLRKKA